jgi:hypothetical protein
MAATTLSTRTAVDAAFDALLDMPTALVASATRRQAAEVAGILLTPGLLRRLGEELRAATGAGTFAMEHMRDRRPLAEMLDVARLVAAQRRVLAAA